MAQKLIFSEGMVRSVLFNGQGDFVDDFLVWKPGDPVPPGCFVGDVAPEDLKLIRSGKAQMRADGTLYHRR